MCGSRVSLSRCDAALTPAPQTGKLRSPLVPALRLPFSVSIPDPRETAQAALEPGERLVWVGQPEVARLAWRDFDLKHWLRSAPAAAVAVILLWQAAAEPADSIFTWLYPLAALAALFVAVWPLMAPLRAARAARQTVYAVTDRRVFILETYPREHVRSFPPEELEEPQWRDRGDGRGDVSFAPVIELERTRQGQRSRLRKATFFSIPEPARVAREIGGLKARAAAGRRA